MNQKRLAFILAGLIFAASAPIGGIAHAADKATDIPVYDESAYTEYVENKMK